jgi:hypothetical protein
MKLNNNKKFIPLDKSWINRMGVLDIVNGYSDIKDFLDKQSDLGDDLLALKRASELWDTDLSIDVGESGTLYRILQFISWKLNLNKKFITHGTLTERVKKMPNDPRIVNLSLRELRALSDDTSQRVTAAILLGNKEPIPKDFDYEIKFTTVEALAHWKKQRKAGLVWEPRYDETIQKQAEAFLELQKGSKPNFLPQHSEDYCFARVFGYMSKQEGEAKWSKLHGHESDRLEGMEKAINQAKEGKMIDSKDHRVVQAIAMWGVVNKKKLKFIYPEAVNKTWPKFWDFLATVN